MADAPGGPGIVPRWTSSERGGSDTVGVGTALSPGSRVWFTVSRGILNEAYYPQVDQACIRDFGFLVTDGEGFFAEEKCHTDSVVHPLLDGVPAYSLVNTHRPAIGPPRFRIHKRILTDPQREVVLQEVRLEVLGGGRLRLFALLAPHLVNAGTNNTGWIGEYKGQPMLFAEGEGTSLALAASVPWAARSAGFAGTSDGWQDCSRHFRMAWQYDRAAEGSVALTGELALGEDGRAVLALGFGRAAAEAALRARASLLEPFERLAGAYGGQWRGWQSGLRPLDRTPAEAVAPDADAPPAHNTYRVSTAMLRVHEASTFPGAIIPSLSVPWGAARDDDDLGAYHLVWPRDLVEVAGGLLAAGAHAEALRALAYLRAIQEADGSWPQNCWLDGTPYWRGVRMDECAFPVLLVELALREGALARDALPLYWPMVRAAAGFLVRRGPVTGQDRWEENGGYSPFTLAVEISALLIAADVAEACGEAQAAPFLRETADQWNDGIEGWTYATGTPLAAAAGVAGYYVRLAPERAPSTQSDLHGIVPLRNHPEGEGEAPASSVVSPDALALVRFGLRAADDPRILDTLRVIDHALRVELPGGPGWHRYSGDGYGEHADGAPFDGTGIGRAWPLLTGERAHYALLAGDVAQAERLLAAMESFASRGALLPEQVWDAPDNAVLGLARGQPTGSAMPLAWAHAEHVKLLRSLADHAAAQAAGTHGARHATAGPGSAGPGSAGPGSAGPGSAGPGSAGPGSAGTGSAGTGSAATGSAATGSAGPPGSAPPGASPAEAGEVARTGVFDTPEASRRRYGASRPRPVVLPWRPGLEPPGLPAGRTLRVELTQPAVVHWSDDGWATPREVATADTGLGVHVADLPTAALPEGGSVLFTWRDLASGAWTGTDHRLVVTSERVP